MDTMNYKMPLIIGLLLFVVVFTLQNTEEVQINFLFWDIAASRALMIFLVLSAGFVVGWFANSLYRKNESLVNASKPGGDSSSGIDQ